jgi:hypothetical protein
MSTGISEMTEKDFCELENVDDGFKPEHLHNSQLQLDLTKPKLRFWILHEPTLDHPILSA